MTVRRFTAQCLPPLRNKRNSTGDCHAAEFQTGRCRRWVIRGGPKQAAASPDVRFAPGTPPFTKLLLRPIALFASLDWEIGPNRAKFRESRACCRPLGGALHGRQEDLT